MLAAVPNTTTSFLQSASISAIHDPIGSMPRILLQTNSQIKEHEHVKNWVINNQLSRRNITPETRLYLIGRRYQVEKGTVGAPKSNGNAKKQSGQNDQIDSTTTAEKVAAETKVSEATVRRAEKFAAAEDRIAANLGDEIKTKLLAGDLEISNKDVLKLANKPADEQVVIIEAIAAGEHRSLTGAARFFVAPLRRRLK